MQYVLMLVAGGILLASTWIGWRKGFLKMTLSMLAFLLVILVTWIFSPKVTDILRTMTPLYSVTQRSVEEVFRENLDSVQVLTREEQEQILEDSFLPSYMVDALMERSHADSNSQLDATVFIGRIGNYVAGIVVNLCGIVLTFLLAGLLIHLVSLLLSLADWIPGLNAVNKVGGGFLGFMQGLIWIWLLCFIITLLAPTGIGQKMLLAIEENAFLSMIYNGVLSFSSVLKFGLTFL